MKRRDEGVNKEKSAVINGGRSRTKNEEHKNKK